MSNLFGLCLQTRLCWSLANTDITDNAEERVSSPFSFFFSGCTFSFSSLLRPVLLPSFSFSFSSPLLVFFLKLQLWLRIADLALHKIMFLSKPVVRAPSNYERHHREQFVSDCEKWGDPFLEGYPSFHEWWSEVNVCVHNSRGKFMTAPRAHHLFIVTV